MKELKKYRFYFYYQQDGKKHIVKVQACKSPGRTKTYKRLENNFDEGFIFSFGYEQVND